MYTYRNPILSLWQSSVAEVHRQRASVQARMVAPGALAAPRLVSEEDLMTPAHAVGEALSTSGTLEAAVGAVTGGTLRSQALFGTVADCAEIAAKYLWAEVQGNHDAAAVLEGELKDSACDVAGWSECVTTYLGYKLLLQHPQYRPGLDPVFSLKPNAKIAILSDWGTGDAVAINVLQQVATHKPDLLLHLGDIYYAGTRTEAQANFLDICHTVLGAGVPLYSLCGNHDMYSSGRGYYSLVDAIGQQASYFCLQNDEWMFLAMDTGFNDRNPFTVASNMTSLVQKSGWSEADWLLQKIAEAGSRKVVLLSHHQLFSPFAPVGAVDGVNYAWNPNLFQVFGSVLPKIAAWFWGHEHTLAAFQPYMGLARGRCVGASAVPVFLDQQQYAPAAGLKTFDGDSVPTWDPGAVLGNNGTDYDNSFAIMTLTGAAATVDYYTVPLLGSATKLQFSDAL